MLIQFIVNANLWKRVVVVLAPRSFPLGLFRGGVCSTSSACPPRPRGRTANPLPLEKIKGRAEGGI